MTVESSQRRFKRVFLLLENGEQVHRPLHHQKRGQPVEEPKQISPVVPFKCPELPRQKSHQGVFSRPDETSKENHTKTSVVNRAKQEQFMTSERSKQHMKTHQVRTKDDM